jgi:hypothetical protein
LYVVNVQRSAAQPLGKILESIAHPPIDEEDRSGSNGRRIDERESSRNGASGPSLERRRRSNDR